LLVPLTGIVIAAAGVLIVLGLFAIVGGALFLFYLAIEFEDGIGIAIEPALFD
jgi:hypothetical protein